MVVASVVGGELWDKARKAYMTAHPRPFMRLLHSVLSGDWQGEPGGLAGVARRHARGAACDARDRRLLVPAG